MTTLAERLPRPATALSATPALLAPHGAGDAPGLLDRAADEMIDAAYAGMPLLDRARAKRVAATAEAMWGKGRVIG